MHVLILGAAGMVGRKLIDRLVRDGGLNGKAIERLTLADVMSPEKPAGFAGAVDTVTMDLSAQGEAEADFEKGYRINLDATRALIEAIRRVGNGYKPKVIYTSSIAVFGAPFPDAIPDEFHLTPLTCYGTQKAIGELLLADYTRRGFLEGVGLRFPTICVRPGKPNKAASGFFSSIVREPLAGQEAVLPVPDTVRHTHASPRAAAGFLVHAASLTRAQLGDRINLTMPGISCTVAEQIDSLKRIAGPKVAARIRREPDETIGRIVAGWPQRFDARRAAALGFRAETSFDDIVRIHIEEELNGKIVA